MTHPLLDALIDITSQPDIPLIQASQERIYEHLTNGSNRLQSLVDITDGPDAQQLMKRLGDACQHLRTLKTDMDDAFRRIRVALTERDPVALAQFQERLRLHEEALERERDSTDPVQDQQEEEVVVKDQQEEVVENQQEEVVKDQQEDPVQDQQEEEVENQQEEEVENQQEEVKDQQEEIVEDQQEEIIKDQQEEEVENQQEEVEDNN